MALSTTSWWAQSTITQKDLGSMRGWNKTYKRWTVRKLLGLWLVATELCTQVRKYGVSILSFFCVCLIYLCGLFIDWLTDWLFVFCCMSCRPHLCIILCVWYYMYVYLYCSDEGLTLKMSAITFFMAFSISTSSVNLSLIQSTCVFHKYTDTDQFHCTVCVC